MLGNLLLYLWPKRKPLIFENTDSPATWNKITWNEYLEQKQRWKRNSFLCVCVCVKQLLWQLRNDTLWSNALFRHNTCQNCARATLEMRAQMSYSIQLLSTQKPDQTTRNGQFQKLWCGGLSSACIIFTPFPLAECSGSSKKSTCFACMILLLLFYLLLLFLLILLLFYLLLLYSTPPP